MTIRQRFKRIAVKYARIVVPPARGNYERTNELNLWKDRLFNQFLLYCFPVSLIAVVPCVYISFKNGYLLTGCIDLACFLLVAFITFSQYLSLTAKKYCFITMFYFLGIFLTAQLGYIGPGLFYLLAITLYVSLFFPVRQAYYSIISNSFIIALFGAEIYFRPFKIALLAQYTAAQWLAYSSNLIFVSIILVVLIEKMFNGLQTVIENKESSKAKYQTIFDHSPSPMWLFDVESLRFLDVNHAAVAHYGYTKSEFLAMTIRDIRPEGEIETLEKTVIDNRGAYKFYQQGIPHRKKNGEIILVTIDSSLIEYNGMQAKLVLASDITQQMKAEAEAALANEKVRQSEFNLRAIFDSTEEGFVLLDSNHKIVVANEKTFKFIVEDLHIEKFRQGDSIFNYLEQSRVDHFRSYLEKVQAGELFEYDRRYVSDGRLLWIHYTLTPVFDGERIIGTCITGRDVTGLKSYLEKIEEQNRTLKEISWTQSHVARAPLARMMGLANLILSEKDEIERKEMIRLLEVSTKEFDQTIKEITDKIEKQYKEVNMDGMYSPLAGPNRSPISAREPCTIR
jgi:PAS domain S-box-containing protein